MMSAMTWNARASAGAAAIALLIAAAPCEPADRDQLLYHAETFEGAVLASHNADTPFNPASLVKVGTSMWALESLGPDHRYRTVFGVDGAWDKKTGSLDGSLVVQGWGDPDFQAENVFLVARMLNQLRLTRVKGSLAIDGDFWIGWENGVEKRVLDPRKRVDLMGRRLRMVLDPKRWDRTTRAAWEAVCARRGWDPADPPRVEIVGSTRSGAPQGWVPVAVHRSNPLRVLLRRFDVYSNNDIVRIADGLGGPQGLEAFLEQRLGVPAEALELESASGERRNRVTAKIGVLLMRAFVETTRRLGLAPSDLLPVIGCDVGATSRKFPKLAAQRWVGSVTVKTGTLTTTDGGVAVVGGLYTSPDLGQVLFCVAATGTGWNETHWRGLEQSWVLDLLEKTGGAVQHPCGPELPFSDTFAEVDWVVSWESL
jgi:D-alanyl-D-alanine carboxypeptidase/D-alanyl-D-alanine-endopeptidase (penicillin-binding protein 4)